MEGLDINFRENPILHDLVVDYVKEKIEFNERVHCRSLIKRAFDEIIQFNIEKGLSEQGINVKRGASFILEELMEMFEENAIPRETALRMIEDEKAFKSPKTDMRIILDSYGDIIVFAIGEMFKTLVGLGNSQEEAKDLIGIIMSNISEANLKKCLEKDKEGKLMKGEGFTPPHIPLNVEELKNISNKMAKGYETCAKIEDYKGNNNG